MCVVDEEEGEQDNAIVRVDDEEDVRGREQGQRHHPSDEAQAQAVVQNRPTHRVIDIRMKRVKGQNNRQDNGRINGHRLHIVLVLDRSSRRGQAGADSEQEQEQIIPRVLVPIRNQRQQNGNRTKVVGGDHFQVQTIPTEHVLQRILFARHQRHNDKGEHHLDLGDYSPYYPQVFVIIFHFVNPLTINFA